MKSIRPWEPVVARSQDGYDIPFFDGNGVRFRILTKDTGGAFECYERYLGPGEMGTDLHVHSNTDEFFHVLEGVVTIQIGSDSHSLEANSWVAVPRGVPHAFRNASEHPCKVLITFTPGLSHDQFFEGMAKAWSTPEERQQSPIDALRRQFGAYTSDEHGNARDGLPELPIVPGSETTRS